MDVAGGTSRCAVATKLCAPLTNALIWLPACRTSGGTPGYRGLIPAWRNPPCCTRGGNKPRHPKRRNEDQDLPATSRFLISLEFGFTGSLDYDFESNEGHFSQDIAETGCNQRTSVKYTDSSSSDQTVDRVKSVSDNGDNQQNILQRKNKQSVVVRLKL